MFLAFETRMDANIWARMDANIWDANGREYLGREYLGREWTRIKKTFLENWVRSGNGLGVTGNPAWAP